MRGHDVVAKRDHVLRRESRIGEEDRAGERDSLGLGGKHPLEETEHSARTGERTGSKNK